MPLEPFVEIGILAALATPAWRAVASSDFRRIFPYEATRIAVVLGLYAAVIGALALYEPAWLRVPALLAAGVGAFLLWRARPQYGVASGLPPGSLSPLPLGPSKDPNFFARQAERYGDIFKSSQFGRPMVCIVGLERSNHFLLENDEWLHPPPLPFSRFIEGGYLRYLPETTHLQYRQLFSSVFAPEVMRRAEARLAAAFRKGLGAMAQACNETGPPDGERVRPHVMNMMFAAWAELFYGIDDRHPDFDRLKTLSRVIDIRKARWARHQRVGAALDEIEAILRRQVDRFDDDAAYFLAVLVREHPEALGDRTVLGNLIYIMQVSWGDVSGLLLWVFKMLDDHPEWRERLASDLRDSHEEDAKDLATRIVQETLRFQQSEYRYRRTDRDLELEGFRIPKGWFIRICVRESHQNPEIFPQPARFDPDRFAGRTFTRAEYAPFGVFRLACIGEQITKTAARIFATELVSGFDWKSVDDGPAQILSSSHNAPNTRWRVKLTVRAADSAARPPGR